MKEVVSALNPVEHHWRMIGKHLRISSRVLDKIEKNPRHRHNTANFVVEMVQQWLSLNYNYDRLGLPCWKLLVMAVAKGSGDNTYALQMAKKYRCGLIIVHLCVCVCVCVRACVCVCVCVCIDLFSLTLL